MWLWWLRARARAHMHAHARAVPAARRINLRALRTNSARLSRIAASQKTRISRRCCAMPTHGLSVINGMVRRKPRLRSRAPWPPAKAKLTQSMRSACRHNAAADVAHQARPDDSETGSGMTEIIEAGKPRKHAIEAQLSHTNLCKCARVLRAKRRSSGSQVTDQSLRA